MKGRIYFAALFGLLLTVSVTSVAHAAFPGENGRIVFTSRIADPDPNMAGPPQVFSINPDGSDLTRLTFSGLHETPGVFSPDGTRIVFSREQRPWYMDAAGGNEVRGSGIPGPDYTTDYSADGASILVEGSGDIWSVRVDGTDARLVAASGAWERAGVSSPDGERIAFLSSFDTFAGQTSDIYTTKLDGTEDWVRLTNNRFEEGSVDYSPDGSRIAFTSDRTGAADVYTMNVDGTGVTRLTDNPAYESLVAWSPDGKRLVFTSERELFGNPKLYVMNADGTGQVKIGDAVVDRGVDWQPLQNRPPDCTALTADPATFVRQDRRLRWVRVGGAVDPDGDALDVTVTGVSQDEPVTGRGDRTRPDARLRFGDAVQVRAERSPLGDGRVYRVDVTVTDSRGAGCTGVATVSVQRHRHRPAVDSAPPSYDSLARSSGL